MTTRSTFDAIAARVAHTVDDADHALVTLAARAAGASVVLIGDWCQATPPRNIHLSSRW